MDGGWIGGMWLLFDTCLLEFGNLELVLGFLFEVWMLVWMLDVLYIELWFILNEIRGFKSLKVIRFQKMLSGYELSGECPI